MEGSWDYVEFFRIKRLNLAHRLRVQYCSFEQVFYYTQNIRTIALGVISKDLFLKINRILTIAGEDLPPHMARKYMNFDAIESVRASHQAKETV